MTPKYAVNAPSLPVLSGLQSAIASKSSIHLLVRLLNFGVDQN